MLALLAGLAAQSGCGPAGGSPTKITNRRADASAQWSDDLFSFALENLNHLEDNDCEEMLRSTQQRLAALQQPKLAAGMLPPDALLASWPEPDMLRQVVSRLNQWVDTQESPPSRSPTPCWRPCLPILSSCRWSRTSARPTSPHTTATCSWKRSGSAMRLVRNGPAAARPTNCTWPAACSTGRSAISRPITIVPTACRKCPGKPCSWGMARAWNGHGRISCSCGSAESTPPCWPCPGKIRRRRPANAGASSR